MSGGNFYIIKKVVYLQGVYGPFESRIAAVCAFYAAHARASRGDWDFDGYHSYYIVSSLGKAIGGYYYPPEEDRIDYEAKK